MRVCVSMKRRSSKSGAAVSGNSAQPTDAKRVRTTRAQELMAAASKRQIAQRSAEGRGVEASVPTFSRNKTASGASARTNTTIKTKPLTPVHHYNFRQGTPPPARYHAGSKSTSLNQTSNLANRMRAALPQNAIEQTVCCEPWVVVKTCVGCSLWMCVRV